MKTTRLRIRPFAAAGIIVAAIGLFLMRPALFSPSSSAPDTGETVAKLDQFFAAQWKTAGIEPAARVENDLILLRRLSLALTGTVPSLAEIREFESDRKPERIQRWTARLIQDRRFVEYFGFTLAGAFLDVESDDLEAHSRLRFVEWIGENIQKGRPYDEMARVIIAGQGALADAPGSAPVAAEIAAGPQAAERLAARTSRVILGQRIDCAQCHDHPFDEWTQDDFEGIAAHYGQVNYRKAILQDNQRGPFIIDDTRNNEKREVAPSVPFLSELRPEEGVLRNQLADWATHPDNRMFRRAIANRIWGLMLGEPFLNPVDNLPLPAEGSEPDALDLLGDDLAAHGYDIRRVIHVIADSLPFQLASTHPDSADSTDFAIFPVTALDPHQLVLSMQQAGSATTIAPEKELSFVRIQRFESRFSFVQQYGDISNDGEVETGTVSRAADRLAGDSVRRFSRSRPWNAAGRMASLASPAKAIDTAFLACLSRRPTAEEAEFFLSSPSKNANQRSRTLEDVYWVLFNSAEFCWNH